MKRISGQAAYCLNRAASCRKLAEDERYDAAAWEDFRDMESRWLALANSYSLAEEISGYIEWQAQRVEPPPDHGENIILRLPLSS
jgi:hypothetical protein